MSEGTVTQAELREPFVARGAEDDVQGLRPSQDILQVIADVKSTSENLQDPIHTLYKAENDLKPSSVVEFDKLADIHEQCTDFVGQLQDWAVRNMVVIDDFAIDVLDFISMPRITTYSKVVELNRISARISSDLVVREDLSTEARNIIRSLSSLGNDLTQKRNSTAIESEGPSEIEIDIARGEALERSLASGQLNPDDQRAGNHSTWWGTGVTVATATGLAISAMTEADFSFWCPITLGIAATVSSAVGISISADEDQAKSHMLEKRARKRLKEASEAHKLNKQTDRERTAASITFLQSLSSIIELCAKHNDAVSKFLNLFIVECKAIINALDAGMDVTTADFCMRAVNLRDLFRQASSAMRLLAAVRNRE